MLNGVFDPLYLSTPSIFSTAFNCWFLATCMPSTIFSGSVQFPVLSFIHLFLYSSLSLFWNRLLDTHGIWNPHNLSDDIAFEKRIFYESKMSIFIIFFLLQQMYSAWVKHFVWKRRAVLCLCAFRVQSIWITIVVILSHLENLNKSKKNPLKTKYSLFWFWAHTVCGRNGI